MGVVVAVNDELGAMLGQQVAKGCGIREPLEMAFADGRVMDHDDAKKSLVA